MSENEIVNRNILTLLKLLIRDNKTSIQLIRREISNLLKELYKIFLEQHDMNINFKSVLDAWLQQLNLLAWDYISKKGVLQYEGRYYRLQNTQIWFLGLNMREILDKLKGSLPRNAKMSKFSFHHEPPYLHH